MPATRVPACITGHLRYDFQIEMCRIHHGTVLNVGCNEDPAGLHKLFGDRIVNCDLEMWDSHMNRPNAAVKVFNCLEFPWPVEDDSAELVLFGDILEHFTPTAIIEALMEARRVAPHVAITVPEDTRIDPEEAAKDWEPGKYDLHTTVVTDELLQECLAKAGWATIANLTGEWGFDGIQGYCVLAERAVTLGDLLDSGE